MAVQLMRKVTAVGASVAWTPPGLKRIIDHSVQVHFDSRAATAISALTMVFQGSLKGATADDAVVSNPVLAVGSTAERVGHGAFDVIINGTAATIAANAAGSVFTDAHVIGDGASALWGVVMVYTASDGTLLTKVPLATQVYASAEAARDAADVLVTPKDHAFIGHILIQSDTTTWTANTDDMTDASDLTTADFYSATTDFLDIATHAFTADEITAQKAIFHITASNLRAVRLYLKTLTGTGEVDAWYQPAEV